LERGVGDLEAGTVKTPFFEVIDMGISTLFNLRFIWQLTEA
jgi:hypothetical protein